MDRMGSEEGKPVITAMEIGCESENASKKE